MGRNIEGVLVSDLKLLPNERGRLMEIQRRDDPHFPGFGQAYVTETFAGIVKAWYRHNVQVDQIAPIRGLVKLVLYDDRADSVSHGVVQEIILGELAPRLVLIPPLVWHGFKALGETSAFLLHLNDRPFEFAQPDEERLPADDSRIPYSWQ